MKTWKEKKTIYAETFSLHFRAIKIWWKISPMIFISKSISAIYFALIPYIGIYISALFINELSNQRRPEELKNLVLLSLISALIIAVIDGIIQKWKEFYDNEYYYKKEKIFTNKLLDMDFCDIDDQKTHDKLSQIKQNENWNNSGIGKVLGMTEEILGSLFGIIGSITLSISLFIKKVPENNISMQYLSNPLFLIFIVAVMFVVIILSPLCHNKAYSFLMNNDFVENIKYTNRLYLFYYLEMISYSRAADVRIYHQNEYSISKLNESVSSYNLLYPIYKKKYAPMNSLSVAIGFILTAIIYLFVCLKAWAGAFGIGSVTQYISAITLLSHSLSKLLQTLGEMHNNTPYLKTVFEFLDIPHNMYKGSLTIEKRNDRKYEIEFRNVSFQYPNTNTYALRHVNMKFKIGQRLAVVGENGSGKTTFIKLLCRLYDPTEGDILLTGIDIQTDNYKEYLSIFSIIFQDFKLLSFSLAENIAISTKYNESRVLKCLESAGFSERLKTLKKGIDTCLYKDFDDKGIEISGGEAQKIAIARTLYKDSPFIILDEPTAALDPIAECEIYSKFNEIVDDKTAIYISHRLSSCRFCNEIAVFDNGTIIQQGSHDSLMNHKDGKYYKLWHAQAQYYTE